MDAKAQAVVEDIDLDSFDDSNFNEEELEEGFDIMRYVVGYPHHLFRSDASGGSCLKREPPDLSEVIVAAKSIVVGE